MHGYLKRATLQRREKYTRTHATWFSQFTRLPYFDMCHTLVVDPTHNLLLGLVKSHFYHIWIQLGVLRKTKELRSLRAALATVSGFILQGRIS